MTQDLADALDHLETLLAFWVAWARKEVITPPLTETEQWLTKRRARRDSGGRVSCEPGDPTP